MSTSDDPVNKFLDLVPDQAPAGKVPAVIEDQVPSDVYDHADDDFEDARDTIDEVLEQGMASFKEFAQIASQSQHPRAFEVLSTMMKTMGDLATAKLDAAEKRKKVKGMTGKAEGGSENVQNKTINNTVFIGSTAALQKYLDERQPVIEEEVTVVEDDEEDIDERNG